MKRITLKDVAKASGVSIMTASRALRGALRVSPESAEKVKQSAIRLGYLPDPALSALISYRLAKRKKHEFSVVAFVTHFRTEHEWRENHVCIDSFEGAKERGASMGFSVQPFWTNAAHSSSRSFSRMLISRGIRGLLMCPLPDLSTQPDLEWEKFSSVAIGYTLQRPALPFVASHHSQSLSLAFNELHKLGYQRPGLVLNPWANERTFHQLAGAWYYEQQSLNAEDRLPVLHPGINRPSLDALEWYKNYRPDVIIDTFAQNQPIILDLGLKAPEQVGYLNTNVQLPNGSLSGIYQNFNAIGRSAMDRLVVMLNRGETGVPALRDGLITFGTWCPGKTLKKQP
jgi:DNA-binding LacI/PurR family transcriptional regulator